MSLDIVLAGFAGESCTVIENTGQGPRLSSKVLDLVEEECKSLEDYVEGGNDEACYFANKLAMAALEFEMLAARCREARAKLVANGTRAGFTMVEAG